MFKFLTGTDTKTQELEQRIDGLYKLVEQQQTQLNGFIELFEKQTKVNESLRRQLDIINKISEVQSQRIDNLLGK